ncbi:MAG: DUF362 domain-containing protein [Bryobacteraceae bacterium]
MQRRTFLKIPAAATPLAAAVRPEVPEYRLVSSYHRTPGGMPGPFKGSAVSVHCERSIREDTGAVDASAVEEMIAGGMKALTGESTPLDAWRRFFSPSDVIGIKLNCSGAPKIMSNPHVVGEVVRNLIAIGVRPQQIYLYERFENQLESVPYQRFVPEGVHIVAIEVPRRSILGYDPETYVEVDFFGEEDTRSNLIELVSRRFDKILNVPNMKDHGAAGVTGCLKNIAYGNFSNVARSHRNAKTHTKTFIGTLASLEPLRSKTVLHVMDGLKGVWQGGPFVRDPRFIFYPKQMMFGTDPVAMDRLLLDVIVNKREAEGALSIWDRSLENVKPGNGSDPRVNHYIREPGHIQYASSLGLGTYDLHSIRHKKIEI